MSVFIPVTDAELAQARQDPQFRQKLIAENLERLLIALNKLRAGDDGTDPDRARQLKEGVELAVKLADLLHAAAGEPSGPAHAA